MNQVSKQRNLSKGQNISKLVFKESWDGHGTPEERRRGGEGKGRVDWMEGERGMEKQSIYPET